MRVQVSSLSVPSLVPPFPGAPEPLTVSVAARGQFRAAVPRAKALRGPGADGSASRPASRRGCERVWSHVLQAERGCDCRSRCFSYVSHGVALPVTAKSRCYGFEPTECYSAWELCMCFCCCVPSVLTHTSWDDCSALHCALAPSRSTELFFMCICRLFLFENYSHQPELT